MKSIILTDNYDDFLSERLRDSEYAAEYLNAAMESGEEVFLTALQDVAKAQKLHLPKSKKTLATAAGILRTLKLSFAIRQV